MSNRKHNGSSDQHHQRSVQMHDNPAHAHLVAATETQGKQNHHDLALRAHGLWEARGRPEGSPDEDWFRATQQIPR